MRSTRWITVIGLGLACGLGGCAFAVSNTESLLTQAGFRKLPADTPKRAEHLQTVAPHKLIRRTADGKAYYVFAVSEQLQVPLRRERGRVREVQDARPAAGGRDVSGRAAAGGELPGREVNARHRRARFLPGAVTAVALADHRPRVYWRM